MVSTAITLPLPQSDNSWVKHMRGMMAVAEPSSVEALGRDCGGSSNKCPS
jgi:hypothetical protein